ncbi:MAG TPA: murein biosynthesis integral membrane protein MurJ [Bacillales bacterium]
MRSKLAIASVLFIGATLLLKVSGLIRDIVIAYFFGDSYVAGAYLAAFVIPNMFILFMVTGMKNAFVPSYIDALQQQRGSYHLGQIFKGTALVSLAIAVLGAVTAPVYIPLLYPDFGKDATQIAVGVAVIYFCSVVFVGMNAVLEGFFDARSQFSLSIVSQIIVIFGAILSAIFFAPEIGPYSLAVGYLAGAVLSLLFKAVLLRREKTAIQLKGKMDWLGIKKFYVIFIPVGLTVAVGKINLLVDNIFASYFQEGVVTYINYARTLTQFPTAIFGVTIGTIIFPFISKATAKKDWDLFRYGIEKGLTTMFFILLPAVTGMMLLMPNIIELLYERGAFTHEATLSTSEVAYFYFGSVVFFSIQDVMNKGFYSLKKGYMITILGISAIVLNIIFNYLFTLWMGYQGIPLASSVMALFYVGGSLMIFLKLVKGMELKKVGFEYAKVCLAVLVMAGAVLAVKPYLDSFGDLVIILLISILGAVVYALCAFVLRVEALPFLLKKFFGGKKTA